MPLEIEKKYLVLPQQLDQHIQLDQYPHKPMVQGYLASWQSFAFASPKTAVD